MRLFQTIALLSLLSGSIASLSEKFKLQLVSQDKSFDGKFANACHSGAALAVICVNYYPGPGNDFYVNTTTSSPPPGRKPASGVLTYDLNLGGNYTYPSTSEFGSDLTSTTAVLSFGPGSPTTRNSFNTIGFDDKDLLYIPAGYDTTKRIEDQKPRPPLYNWAVCKIYSGSANYHYDTLVWVIGGGKGEDKSCVSVGVKRVWPNSK